MNDTSYCGNEGALIAFLYDECEPAEREAMAAHVAHCASCADEIESLRLTRTQLSAWAPPAAALGFRITRDQDSPVPDAIHVSGGQTPAVVLTSPRWWKQPLPAWAQMAAAVAIFAAGMTVGASRNVDESAAVATAPPAPAVSTASAPVVSREDFDQLRAEVVRLRSVPPSTATRVVAGIDEDAVLHRVQTLVDERIGQSEERQRRDFTLLTSRLARDFETVRRQDLFSMQEAMGRVEGVTAWQLRQQNDLLMRVTSTQPMMLGR